MTIYKPNLQIKNLSVFKSGHVVFDEAFHSGLNIIRGENSSGKSTIMDFLFYGLGGDLLESEWRESALLCDTVSLELSINGKELVVSRDIDSKSSQPMRMFFGPWEEAKVASNKGWERYPYRRGDKESFSQVLFRFLGLPEVQYDNQNTKITMNQVLRLLYSDQLSSVQKIFRQVNFDDAITRQSVGDLLCGAYSDLYYRSKIRKKEAEAELKEIEQRKKSLIRAYGKGGHPLTSDWLDQEHAEATQKLDGLNTEIDQLEQGMFQDDDEDAAAMMEQTRLADKVTQLQQSIDADKSRLREIEYEIADSVQFIDTLERKVADLSDTSSVVDQFANLTFEFCPACLAEVKPYSLEGACSLCKTPFDQELTKKRSLRLLNDYKRQLAQSETLQDIRKNEAHKLRSVVAEKIANWRDASRQYQSSLSTPSSEIRLKARRLNREVGRIERELEEIAERRAIVEELRELSVQADTLNDEITQLEANIESETRRTKAQISKARRKIELQVLDFLMSDLERQSTFQKATSFDFDFAGDRMSVDGESYFSASSMVYMRNSFFASFLFAATEDPSFSHPRFLMLDTVEDKGMEQERSQHFQRILAEKSETAESEHQLIIATSMIAPDLDVEKYTIGKRFNHEEMSLDIVST